MGIQDRDWYKDELRERERKLNRQRSAKRRFRIRWPFRRYDLSAYNFERPPTWHPLLIIVVWVLVFLVLFTVFKRFR